MRGIWRRPWARNRYHLFVVLENVDHPKGQLVTRRACSRSAGGGLVKFFDVREDPAPPAAAFPPCAACLRYQKVNRSPTSRRTP